MQTPQTETKPTDFRWLVTMVQESNSLLPVLFHLPKNKQDGLIKTLGEGVKVQVYGDDVFGATLNADQIIRLLSLGPSTICYSKAGLETGLAYITTSTT